MTTPEYSGGESLLYIKGRHSQSQRNLGESKVGMLLRQVRGAGRQPAKRTKGKVKGMAPNG